MSDKIGSNTRGRAGLGRPKGSPNKINAGVKSMILGALDELGGQAWLVQTARAEPRTFMVLLARILPSEMTLDANVVQHEPITMIRRIVIDAKPEGASHERQ